MQTLVTANRESYGSYGHGGVFRVQSEWVFKSCGISGCHQMSHFPPSQSVFLR
jgi:hypothetical protein